MTQYSVVSEQQRVSERVSASQRVHGAMGGGAHPLCSDVDIAGCWVCGSPARRGLPIKEWMGANFTGQNRVRCVDATHVCESCAVVMSGKPPDTLRMYSVLVEQGQPMLKLNKGQKPAILEFLRRKHCGEWLAGIADSGKKHIVPWSPINPPSKAGTGMVLFEDRLVRLGDWSMVEEAMELLTAGVTKEDMLSGEYKPRAWELSAASLRAFEAKWKRLRGGGWFELAVWLAQRDEGRTAIRMAEEKESRDAKRQRQREAANADRRGAVGNPSGVPAHARSKRAQALGSDSGSDASGRTHDKHTGRVDDESGAVSQVGFSFAEHGGGSPGLGQLGARAKVRK